MGGKGKNIAKCKYYKDRNKRVINKKRKLVTHLKKNKNDIIADKALESL